MRGSLAAAVVERRDVDATEVAPPAEGAGAADELPSSGGEVGSDHAGSTIGIRRRPPAGVADAARAVGPEAARGRDDLRSGVIGSPRSRALAGPIAAAVVPFAAADAPPGLADPAAVLAGLIDLRGGVVLAERLAELDGALPGVAASDPAAVRAMLHTGLAELEGRLDEAFTHAFRPRYRLPSAHRAWLIIERSGLLGAVRPSARSRKLPKELRIAVRHLWAPFGEFLDTHLKRARFALRDLRLELLPQIAGLSEDAARLAQLDGALAEATSGSTERLYRRVAQSAEHAFAEGVMAAWRGWGAEVRFEDFAGGFAPDGWLGDRLAEAQGLYRAVVHHERARLEALVEGACSLVGPR